MIKRATAVVAALAAMTAASGVANAATDVPKGDWSYAAVQDLASKGLIQGYPKSASIFGDRTVNRYEMATLISRVVASVTADPNTAAAPQTQAEINKLVQDYGVELAVIGTDVSNLKLGVQSLTDTALDHQKQIDKLSKTKVESGFGKIKFDGLLQVWAMDGNKDVTNFGGGPGTGLGLSAGTSASTTDGTLASTFRIRRAELKFSGNVNPQAYWLVMFDPSKAQNITVKTPAVAAGSAAGATNTTVATNGTSPLQDFVVGWHLTPSWDFEVGQQKVPLSIESSRSSAALLTIERSLMNTVSYNAGRVGDIRDLGAWARYNVPGKFSGVLAVADDAGNRQNLVDDNNGKELFANGQFFPIPALQVGGYGEISAGTNGPAYTQRRRAGVDFDYVKAQHELTGEYVEGQDKGTVVGNRLKTQSAYATYAYKLNPTWQGVVRYDYFNPDRDQHNTEKDLTLGVNYYLVGNNSKIQFNYIKRNIGGPVNSSGQPVANTSLGAGRWVYFTNFQQSF